MYSTKPIEHPLQAIPVLGAGVHLGSKLTSSLISKGFGLVTDTGHKQSNNIMECDGVWYDMLLEVSAM